MHKEHNRWYADWYDRKGKRRRKAFPSAEQATLYEHDQKALSRPKKIGPAPKLLRSSRPISKRGNPKEPVPTVDDKPCSTSAKPSSAKPAKRPSKP
jgi:hypothetical protein